MNRPMNRGEVKKWIQETWKKTQEEAWAAERAPVAREPLTDEQLDALRQATPHLNFVTLREFRAVARAVEAAHGITGSKP